MFDKYKDEQPKTNNIIVFCRNRTCFATHPVLKDFVEMFQKNLKGGYYTNSYTFFIPKELYNNPKIWQFK